MTTCSQTRASAAVPAREFAVARHLTPRSLLVGEGAGRGGKFIMSACIIQRRRTARNPCKTSASSLSIGIPAPCCSAAWKLSSPAKAASASASSSWITIRPIPAPTWSPRHFRKPSSSSATPMSAIPAPTTSVCVIWVFMRLAWSTKARRVTPCCSIRIRSCRRMLWRACSVLWTRARMSALPVRS